MTSTSKSNTMDCPCCANGFNKLKDDVGQYVKCVRNHKFEVKFVDRERVLVVVSDHEGCKQGDSFPVVGDVTFGAEA